MMLLCQSFHTRGVLVSSILPPDTLSSAPLLQAGLVGFEQVAPQGAGLVSSHISDHLRSGLRPRFGSPLRRRRLVSRASAVSPSVLPPARPLRRSLAWRQHYAAVKSVYRVDDLGSGFRSLQFADGSEVLLDAKEVVEDEPIRHHEKRCPRVRLYADLLQAESGKKDYKGGGGKRGACAGFSAGSRKRLVRSLAMVKTDGMVPYFVTLTYPGVWSSDWRIWKRDLATFRKRLMRVWSAFVSGGAWRVEFQRRGAPHFHLLVWCHHKLKLALFKSWVSRSWADIVKDGYLGKKCSPERDLMYEQHYKSHIKAGVQSVELDGRRAIRLYVSKYVAKVEVKPGEESSQPKQWGRNWGLFGAVDMSPYLEMELSESEYYTLRRTVRKWLRSRKSDYYYRKTRFAESLQILALGAESLPDGASELTAVRMLQLCVGGDDYG